MVSATAFAFTGCGQKVSLTMGTAAEGGIYNALGGALSELAETSGSGCEIRVKNTAGSAANIRLISENYLDIAIAQTDMLEKAFYHDTEDSGNAGIGSYQGYSALTGLYTEACQIVVPADSDIKTVEDLAYKTVSVGEEESGTENNAEEIMRTYGVEDLVQENNMTYAEAAAALQDGSIEAMFCTAGIATDVIEDLAGEMDIRLLEIDEEHQRALAYSYGFYTQYTIPAGTYEGVSEDVSTVGIRAVLIANDEVSDDIAETLTELIVTNADSLGEELGVDMEIDPEDPFEGVTIPVHPGAENYFAEEDK